MSPVKFQRTTNTKYWIYWKKYSKSVSTNL